jgi:hypothetical protein
MHAVLRRRLLALSLCLALAPPLHAVLTQFLAQPEQAAVQDDQELSDGDIDLPGEDEPVAQ